jgi:aminopeptidase N
MTRAAAVTWLVLWGLAAPAAAQRLPQTVLPDHYDIHLSPDFTTDDFQGEETIAVRLLAPTSRITLHAAEIEFRDVAIASRGRTQPAAVSLDAATETVALTVAERLPAGPATLRIRFAGHLNDQLRGFYLSRANNRKYAVTQLEATDARRAFPCFDEPAMKATFAVSVTADDKDTAISNGRLVSDTPGPAPGKHTLRFSTTARMSSYLVAVAVGDFECVSGSAGSIPIRVCATPDKKPLTGFALEAAQYIMGFYNRYFSIAYPFEKLDIVAVPDFAAGAMENTGAIFYREQLLLIDGQTASAAAREQVADILAHEMAHQWLGDLVTMQWWDDIWLNEGFASWMEGKPLREWKPEWNIPIEEAREMQTALGVDALRSTRAIRTRVETPAEINEVFDTIAYQKAGAVLGMVEAYVGPDLFRRGVNAYVTKYAYGNATAEGFWTEMAAVAGRASDTVLASFVTQPGVPLVSLTSACTGGNTRLTLTQQRFVADRQQAGSQPAPAWQIPICVKRPVKDGREGQATCQLLTEPTQTLTLSGCAPWVLANADGLGYFRTAYDPNALGAIGIALSTGALTPVEQMSVLEDTWALVRLGRERISGFLSLSGNLLKSPLSSALQAVMNRLDYIGDYLVDDSARASFQAWVRQLLRPVAGTLGWDAAPDEGEDRRAARTAVLHTLGYTGRDPETLREARRRIDQYLSGGPAIDPNLLGTLVPLAAIDGDVQLYERFIARSVQSPLPGEQYRFRNALAFFADPALTRRTLQYAFSSEIRSQDAPSFIAALLQNPTSRQPAWEQLKANWPALERLGVFQGLPAIVRAAGTFCDETSRADVSQFFSSRGSAGVERTLRQALESIDNCAAFRAQQGPQVTEFLRQMKPRAN